jgi:hypothetical protein
VDPSILAVANPLVDLPRSSISLEAGAGLQLKAYILRPRLVTHCTDLSKRVFLTFLWVLPDDPLERIAGTTIEFGSRPWGPQQLTDVYFTLAHKA